MFGERDPDARGYYGAFGGRFVPETLMAPIEELTREYYRVARRPGVSRASSTRCCSTTSAVRRRSTTRGGSAAEAGGARIFLKREDLTHTGAHKINNALGQALLAAPHGQDAASSPRPARASTAWRRRRRARCSGWSATSTWAPRTWRGRRPTSLRMRLLGADGARGRRRQPHAQGRDQRGDARLGHQRRRHVLPARLSVLGPHPYPLMVREFQSVIGREARAQMLDAGRPAARRRGRLRRRRQQRHRASSTRSSATGRAADRRRGRAARRIAPGRHAARFAGGSAGVLQGTRPRCCRTRTATSS